MYMNRKYYVRVFTSASLLGLLGLVGVAGGSNPERAPQVVGGKSAPGIGTASAGDQAKIAAAPRTKQQALFDRINLAEAWKVTRGSPKVLIGVIDNGFDFYHPDLKDQLIPGYYYPGAYHGQDYQSIAHGTIVSSLMVAKGDGPDAMVGLAPQCKVLTASHGTIEHALVKLQRRVFKDNPKASMADLQKEMLKHEKEIGKFGREWVRFQMENAADAIRYLVDHKVKVINFSGGLKRSLCPFPDVWRKLEDAFAYAAQKNVIIVLGAGNDAALWEDYPGQSDTMIIAGATWLNDTRWEMQFKPEPGLEVKQGSNFGKRLTVMAPSENLLVCVPHEQRFYSVEDGPMGPLEMKEQFKGPQDVLTTGATSCAAPVASALVALIYSIRPELDAKSVVEIVKQGCDDLGEKGYDIYTGYGRVNFGKSIKLAQGWGESPHPEDHAPSAGVGTPINLSASYNAETSNAIAMGTKDDPNNLSEFPTGEQVFAGVRFSVQGMIQLGTIYPHVVKGIKVGARCQRLRLLHGLAGWSDEGATNAVLTLHYADGSTAELAIKYGEHVRDWWNWNANEPTSLDPGTAIAWLGDNDLARARNCRLRVYRSTFANPKPDVVIGTIDYGKQIPRGNPFMLGLSIE
jgi:subtilisin family serine protease